MFNKNRMKRPGERRMAEGQRIRKFPQTGKRAGRAAALLLAGCIALGAAGMPVPVQAAGEGSIAMEEDVLAVNIGETKSVTCLLYTSRCV